MKTYLTPTDCDRYPPAIGPVMRFSLRMRSNVANRYLLPEQEVVQQYTATLPWRDHLLRIGRLYSHLHKQLDTITVKNRPKYTE